MSKEFAILIAVHLSTAEIHCPYRMNESRLADILKLHGLSLQDVFASARSPDLQAAIDMVNTAYRTDKSRACEIAWRNFGPEAPFRDLLSLR
jgi:hypothetical protein